MKGKVVGGLVLGAGVAVVTLVATLAGQSPLGNTEPPAMPLPAKPAVVASTPWTPERLPDGQPNVEGVLWGGVDNGTHNPLENPTGGATPGAQSNCRSTGRTRPVSAVGGRATEAAAVRPR